MEASASFLKKSSKKLLIPLGYSRATSTAPVESNVFLVPFFQKKNRLLLKTLKPVKRLRAA
jgi:hypothetical protein